MRTHTNARRTLRASLLLLLALVFGAPGLAAQQREERPTPRRMPVTVLLLDTLPHDPAGAYVFQRRPGATPQDVILLRTTATAADLADAVRLVLTTRAFGGDEPARETTLRARPRASPGARRAVPSWVRRVLDDVRRTEPREVVGLGPVHTVEIWLPRQGDLAGPE